MGITRKTLYRKLQNFSESK
ncbi:MAG: hypothetical protein ACQEUB_11120 [Thermodesulfobacteriota bacterium]